MPEQPSPGLPRPGEMLGSYRIVSEIGRGGMAAVYAVQRGSDGARCALKLMLPASRSEDLTERFRREFRALSRLDHDNVLKVYESGVYEGRPYFVMELLEGEELREAVEGWRGLPPARRFQRARDVLAQVARALAYIHQRGWVHRDVTPANIMLLPDGRVKLMDFGVVKEPGADLTVAGEVVGTVAYIAPEQIRGERVDARADLYSLGAVLYLMLTGRRPFNARTLAGFLDKHLNTAPRPPHTLAPTVPRELDAICMRLLEKEPALRFASATHLLYMLGEAAPTLPDADGAEPIAGRAWERSSLREALALLDAGRGGLVVLEGVSGMGCSRLLAEAVRQAAGIGMASVTGQNQAPSQPAFAGLRDIYEALTDDGHVAQAVLDVVFEGASEEAGRVDLYAICAAFRELIAQGGPRLICVEDIDRADRGTLEVVEYLVRNLAEQPVLFVLTRRPPADAGADPLGRLVQRAGTTHLVLEPLPVAAVEEMVLYRVEPGPRAAALARRLHRESEGNPFIIEQMLRGLEEAGVVTRGRVTMAEAALEAAALPMPRSIREAISRQLAELSLGALEVARLVALARQEMSFSLLLRSSAQGEAELEDVLEELLAAELLRARRVGMAERFELVHLRLQDVIIDAIPADTRRQLHQRLGEALEQLSRHNVEPIVEQLAHHFDAAEVPAKAYAYMVQAAEKLQGQAFTADALRYLDRAVALEPQTRAHMTLIESERRRADTLLQRSRALYHLGRWDAAVAEARAADALAGALGDHALLARTAAELAIQARALSRYAEAEAQLARAVSHAEQDGDGQLQIVPLYEQGAMKWSADDLEGARVLFERALSLSERHGDGQGLALGSNGLGVLAMCEGRSAEARRYFEKAVKACEAHGLMERLAIARTNLAELSHCMGNIRKGLGLADKTITASREVDHRYGVAIGLRYRALLLGDLGRWAEAEENAAEAAAVEQALGNREEELAGLVALARVRMARGAPEQAEALLARGLELAGRYDTEGYLPVLQAWRAQLLASRGELDAARAVLDELEGEGARLAAPAPPAAAQRRPRLADGRRARPRPGCRRGRPEPRRVLRLPLLRDARPPDPRPGP